MPAPLSNDLRKRLVKAVEGGMSRNAAAVRFEVSISAVVKLHQRWKTSGSYEPNTVGGYRGHKLTAHRQLVEELLKDKPDMTLMELKQRLAAVHIGVSTSAIDRFLNYLGHSYKKNGTRR